MQESLEIRAQVARILRGHGGDIVAEALGVYPFAGVEHVSAADRFRLGELALRLLITAVREGEMDVAYGAAADLGRIASEHGVSVRVLFTLMYLVERAALDRLAQDESFGIESEPWPTLTQMLRHASLDVCAAASQHVGGNGQVIIDPLTTLHTRPVFIAALEKEIQRSERFEYPFAVIVLDVDDLADINHRHGRGAGDRVIERIGIVVRSYFREIDWVGRLGDGMFGVLMPDIQEFNAERLAERIRVAVQERMRLHDHRSDEAYTVTVSAGVLIVPSAERDMKAETLLEQAVTATRRARAAGGNRVLSQRLDS